MLRKLISSVLPEPWKLAAGGGILAALQHLPCPAPHGHAWGPPLEYISFSPGPCGSVGREFNCQSGHISRRWVQSPARHVREATD